MRQRDSWPVRATALLFATLPIALPSYAISTGWAVPGVESRVNSFVRALLPHGSDGKPQITAEGISAAELAQLSACASNPRCPGVGRFRRNYAGLDPTKFIDTGSGCIAGLFTDPATHQNVLSYASTDPESWGDDKNDLQQEFGFSSQQYKQAVNLAVHVRGAVGKRLVLTGFSLGGGEASAGALKLGIHAVTFDASGLSLYTISRLGLHKNLSRADKLIVAYHTEYDPLTFIQRYTDLPNAVGRSIMLSGYYFHTNSGVCAALGVSC